MRRTRKVNLFWPWIWLPALVLLALLVANSPTIAQMPLAATVTPQQTNPLTLTSTPTPTTPAIVANISPAQRCASLPTDPFGYRCDDTITTRTWITATINTELSLDNEVVSDIPLGFTFNFYGTDYSEVNISSNGNLQFTTANTTAANTALPNSSMGVMIAPFWDDLYLPACYPETCQVWYDTTGTPPNQIFVVEWRNVPHFSAQTTGLTFEVQLEEATGDIWVIYQNMPGTYGNGSQATLGIQDGTTWKALQYSYNDATAVHNGLIIRYYNSGTPGPTYTPSPTITSTPTQTPVPTGTPVPDGYEPNDTFAQAYVISVGGLLTGANFVPYPPGSPGPDVDFYKSYVKGGHTYMVQTSGLSLGVDTVLDLYDGSLNFVAENDDIEPGNLASQITWTPPADGFYYFKVSNKDPSPPGTSKTYSIGVFDLTSTPTVTPTPSLTPTASRTPLPSPTQVSAPDAYEPNYDFDHAYPIGLGATYDANFVPWQNQSPDNDFYKFFAKPGETYTCETTIPEGAPTDTNMILYDANSNGIGGNDDVAPGNRASRFTYTSTYFGYVYVLIGNVGDVPLNVSPQYTYTLRCYLGAPATVTPLATATLSPSHTPPPPPAITPSPSRLPTLPPSTPLPPPTATSPVSPQPTGTLGIIIIPQPTPTPGGGGGARMVTIDLEIYYDANQNEAPDPGEGIANISVQVFDDTTEELLASGFSDQDGKLMFNVPAPGDVRLSIPYLNYTQVVTSDAATIQIRVVSQPLPGEIP